MPSIKPSVSISEYSQQILAPYTQTDEGIALSSAIYMILNRYAWAVSQSLPQLTDQQWELLLNVYAGSEISSYPPPYRVASDIMDHCGVLDLSGLDAATAETVRQIHGMSQAQQLAILDTVQRFWAAGSDALQEGESLQDAIKRLSAMP